MISTNTEKAEGTAPILVTGAHRSGTTWVGKMLTASGDTAYISEPLNILHRIGVMRTATDSWYKYICESNQSEYLPGLRETLELRYQTWSEIKSLRSIKDTARMLRDWSTFLNGRIRQSRPLLKDPFAVFSAPWFEKTFNCKVVITIRHPAAFVSSLKRLNWSFDFNHLLSQPLLMQDWLEPFRDQMVAVSKSDADLIAQSCLLWRVIYQTIAQFQKAYPQFIFVRHEDLSINPISGFRELYKQLNLAFSAHAEKAILQSSNSDNPAEGFETDVYSVRLNSRSNLDNWKHRLSSAEISRVHELTRDAAALFYPDWNGDSA
ncbi:sulfotransferase [Chloroflexota bacterium]